MEPGQRSCDGMRSVEPRTHCSPPPHLTRCGHANLITRVFPIGREQARHRDHITADFAIHGVLLQLVVRAIPATAQNGRNDIVFVDADRISHGALQIDNDHPAR